MRAIRFIALIVLLCLTLSGCGTQATPVSTAEPTETPAPTRAPAPVETPTPSSTPEPDVFFLGASFPPNTEEADWSAMGHADMPEAKIALGQLKNLRQVELGEQGDGEDALLFSDVAELMTLRPDVAFHMGFTLYGDHFSTLDEEMDLAFLDLQGDDTLIRQVLPCMPRCHFVNLDSCNIPDEVMGQLREDFPDKGIVWRVFFGPPQLRKYYGIRTDAERLLISDGKYALTSDDVKGLQYCTELKYLDIGHNRIDSIAFVEQMPKLEVAILGLNTWEDLSPIVHCPEIEYLEIHYTRVKDLTPLLELKKLEHLNITGDPLIEDFSVLLQLTGLKRLWIGHANSRIYEYREALEATLSDTEIEIDHGEPDTTTIYWRGQSPRYLLLREQMGYNKPFNQIFSYYYLDPTYRGTHEKEPES